MRWWDEQLHHLRRQRAYRRDGGRVVDSLKNKEVSARKPHVCEWCGEKIDIGERTQYRVYVFQGDFVTGYQHTECYEAMLGADYRDLEDGFEFGFFKRGKYEPK